MRIKAGIPQATHDNNAVFLLEMASLSCHVDPYGGVSTSWHRSIRSTIRKDIQTMDARKKKCVTMPVTLQSLVSSTWYSPAMNVARPPISTKHKLQNATLACVVHEGW